MAKLSTAARHSLPDSSFALSGERFPLTSVSKAHSALSGASHSFNVGNISASEKATVERKAKAYLASHGQPVQS